MKQTPGSIESNMIIKVRALHLAAYIKANGAKLLGVESGQYIFESDRSVTEWRILHSDSCCRRVDRELLDLRKIAQP